MERQDDVYDQEEYSYAPTENEHEEPQEINSSDKEEQFSQEPEEIDNEIEEEQESEKPAKRGRPSGQNRIQQIQREKYRALDELNKLKQENENLRRIASELDIKAEKSDAASLAHYERSALLKRDQALAKKEYARENGDIKAELAADIEISEAVNELQQTRAWKYQKDMELQQRKAEEEYYRQNQYYPDSYQNNSVDEQYVRGWLEDNQWCMPNSRYYDANLTENVRNYSTQLENQLYREGRQDLINSPEYYQELSRYANSLKTNNGDLNMRQARGGGMPVRTSSGRPQHKQQRNNLELSPEEKSFVKSLSVAGVDEETYKKYKLADIKKQAEKGKPSASGRMGDYGW